jgi:hypothetical protein
MEKSAPACANRIVEFKGEEVEMSEERSENRTESTLWKGVGIVHGENAIAKRVVRERGIRETG